MRKPESINVQDEDADGDRLGISFLHVVSLVSKPVASAPNPSAWKMAVTLLRPTLGKHCATSILNRTGLFVCIAALSVGDLPLTPPSTQGNKGALIKI